MQEIPAIVIADAPALDFLNSVATPVDVPVEWLDDGEGLVSWLQQARLVPAPLLQDLRSRALPGELDDIAERARSLREWFRGFVHKHRGRPLTREDLNELEPLNRLLERDETFHQIAPAVSHTGHALQGGNAFELHAARRWRSPEALLFPI